MQFTQLYGDLPFGSNDISYAQNLLNSLGLDLEEIVMKKGAFTISRATLISEKGALVMDLISKWEMGGTAAQEALSNLSKKISGIASMQNQLKDRKPEQETTPEVFGIYFPGKPFRQPPQALQGIFSEPSPETLKNLTYNPNVAAVTAVQRKEMETSGGVTTGVQHRVVNADGSISVVAGPATPAAVTVGGTGIPLIALAAAGAALLFLNK